MKSRRVFATMVLLLVCVTTVSLPLVGQKTGPKYDATTEVTLKGTIQEIKEVPGAFEGTHVLLKTSNGTVLVHLAPPEFLELLQFQVKVGDPLNVVGSKVTIDGVEEVLVKSIEQDNNTMTLRDPDGKPAWTWMKIKN